MSIVFEDARQLPPLGDCPRCGTKLCRMWGEMWDLDLALCPNKNCEYEKQLYTMTCHEVDGTIIMFDTREDDEKMVMNDYQKQAFTTATEESQNIYYMTMGMTGEAGEIANKVKKVMRDGKQLDLEDVAQANLEKLASRKARGVIGGSGDNR